jgi:hypothetical protein
MSPVANGVEREVGDVQRAKAGLRETRREERVVACVESLEDLPRGGLMIEGDVVRHARHEEALSCQELQEVAADQSRNLSPWL